MKSTYFSWVLAKNPYNARAYLLYVWNEWKVGHLAGKVVLKGTDVEGFVDLAVAAFSHLGHGEWWTGTLSFKGRIEDEWCREDSPIVRDNEMRLCGSGG